MDSQDQPDYENTKSTYEFAPIATHIKTKVFSRRDPVEIAEPKDTTDILKKHPWRISFSIEALQIELIFELTDEIIIGRSYPDTQLFNGIDLSPFNGYELGISRKHASLTSIKDQITLTDHQSANGTLLNQEQLRNGEAYPVRNGDHIQLGTMQFRIYFLTNPFEAV